MKLFIFDYDGTLSDSLGSICDCMISAFTMSGQVPPSHEAIRNIVGITLEKAVALLCHEDLSQDVQASITENYKTLYRQKREENMLQDHLFPGVIDILKDIDQSGHLSAVATGKSWRGLKAETERHKIEKYFISLQCSDFHPSKPHPSMLYAALEEAGRDANDAYMIGDSIYDMQMAIQAGVTAIGVSWGSHDVDQLKKNGAAHIISSLNELTEFM
ncbi:MAG: HAD-IA family hydrolase [Pseudomonadota bacterium]